MREMRITLIPDYTLFDPEDWGNIFIRNVGIHVQNHNLSNHRSEDIKTYVNTNGFWVQ
jgi:hypothetical protein